MGEGGQWEVSGRSVGGQGGQWRSRRFKSECGTKSIVCDAPTAALIAVRSEGSRRVRKACDEEGHQRVIRGSSEGHQ